jgi:type I restriction enzyme, S subunit
MKGESQKMSGWRRLPFDEVVADESGGNLKTPKSEFLPAGEFAVVDQGKELVAGYVNEDSRICRSPLPVVVFGDHTRCLKFIDFPFCMGADGIKVLRPKIDADVKYLFHFLRQLHLPDGGYDRHFKYLKRSEVIVPPLVEQRRIAEVLDKAEALRAKRRAALAQLDSLSQSLFLDLFGDPIKNPRSFTVRPLIELIDPQRPISYGILMPGPDQAEGVKYIRVTDMRNGGIELSGIRKTTEAISNAFRRSLLKPADLLMSIRGHVGRLAVVPPELDGANITQDTARLAIVGASSIFVRECLRTAGFQRWMEKHTKGVAVRGINLGDVKLMPIILPPRPSQDEFARRVAAVEKLKTAQRAALAELDALFASLQHRAFRGEL